MVLRSHRENYAALIETQKRLRSPEWTQVSEMQDEVDTSELYEELSKEIKNHLSDSVSMIEDQIAITEMGLVQLSHRLKILDDELSGWKNTRHLTQLCISQLDASSAQLESVLKSAKGRLSPVHHIPKEIWVFIFRLCVTEEFKEYCRSAKDMVHHYNSPLFASPPKQVRVTRRCNHKSPFTFDIYVKPLPKFGLEPYVPS
ncbi:hypothetical protein CPB86DRAFT_836121 [Serendipita vermifera]|nr:hypothetical protein CPB86DRAFT_836121 [Serendipita vermifera]